MKKHTKLKLRFLLPLAALAVAGISVGGFFASPKGQNIINNQSLNAGYGSEFDEEGAQNDLPVNNHQGIKIISQPELDENQKYFRKKIHNFSEKEFRLNEEKSANKISIPITSSSVDKTSTDKGKHIMFSAELSREQFIKQFGNKDDPEVVFKFDLDFSAFNNIFNKPDKDQKGWKNLVSGYALSDLSDSKSNKYVVFNYNLSDAFEYVEGNLKGVLETEMTGSGAYKINFVIVATGVISTKLSDDAARNNLNVDLNNPVLSTIWNDTGTVDLSNYFFPNPNGPVQNEQIQLPKSNSRDIALISKNNQPQYRLSELKIPEEKGFKFPYEVVADLENKLTKQVKVENVQKIFLSKAQLDDALYKGWTDQDNKPKEATNPGLKVGFDLDLSVFDPNFKFIQKYTKNLFGFIPAVELLNGKKFYQDITDYDISGGRELNTGEFKVILSAVVKLDNSVEISLDLLSVGLGYKEPDDGNVNQADAAVWAKIKNVALQAYFDTRDPAILLEDLKPQTRFNFDVSDSNYSAYSGDVDTREVYKRYGGRFTSKNGVGGNYYRPSGAYLANYDVVWSQPGILDLSSVTERNADYFKKSTLTFNFDGISQTDNRLWTVLDTTHANQYLQLAYWPNNASKTPTGNAESFYNSLNTHLDSFRTFQLNLGDLVGKDWDGTKDSQFYQKTWKKMYTFWAPFKQKDNSRYWRNGKPDTPQKRMEKFDETLDKRNYAFKDALMRVQYFIKVRALSNFKVEYQVGLKADSWLWYWEYTTLGSGFWSWGDINGPEKGRAGYKISSIVLNINA